MAQRKVADEALPWVKPATRALARHNLERGFQGWWTTVDGTDELPVRNSVPITFTPAPTLDGHWTVHISWTFRRVPGTEEVVVWQSSIGLNVSGVSFATGQICLVRYDVDHARDGPGMAPLGRHLNVFQPSPLEDNAHFAIPGADHEWDVPEILDLLLAPVFLRDLVDRL